MVPARQELCPHSLIVIVLLAVGAPFQQLHVVLRKPHAIIWCFCNMSHEEKGNNAINLSKIQMQALVWEPRVTRSHAFVVKRAVKAKACGENTLSTPHPEHLC